MSDLILHHDAGSPFSEGMPVADILQPRIGHGLRSSEAKP